MNTGLHEVGVSDPRTVSIQWSKSLSEWARSNDVVPIAGAGIGRNFGLPVWDELTIRLCDAVKELGISEHESIRNESDLLLRAFRCNHLLRKHLAGKEEIVLKTIGTALYKDLEISLAGTAWLECIFQLAKSSGLFVTLNFDDLFEVYVNLVHDKKAVISEYGRALRRLEGQIDSFHVHGLIPCGRIVKWSQSSIVFDTISYIEAYANYLDRLSNAMLYVLTNYRCIFMGLSMVDPNLLRLIRIAKSFRNENTCWGIVFGPVCPELAELLLEWGLAVVDKSGGGRGFDFGQMPHAILKCLEHIDQPDITELNGKFQTLFRT